MHDRHRGYDGSVHSAGDGNRQYAQSPGTDLPAWFRGYGADKIRPYFEGFRSFPENKRKDKMCGADDPDHLRRGTV